MNENICIMAVGGAGCRIIGEFSALEEAKKFRLLALDSDVESLKNSGLPEENRIQVGKLLRSGRGCGGDVISGQQALANERKNLVSILEDIKVLIIVTGLGGGLATGGLPVILGVAAKLHIVTAVIATLPFSMEGFMRRQHSEDKLKNDILPLADAVVVLPNDLLFSTLPAEVTVNDAFKLSDQEVSRSVLALVSILGGGNLFSADFASFTSVLKRRQTLCSLGTARVDDADNAIEAAMEKILASPLLGGPDALDNADAVLFSLLGGPELSLATARAALDLCSRQIDKDAEKNILLGAATAEEFAGKLQLTVLAVRYLDRSEIAREPVRKRGGVRNTHNESSDDELQMDLPNLTVEDKGIMANTVPVVIDGADLDIPAFKRRGIVIDCGK
jgi:cell division protein FtsZ